VEQQIASLGKKPEKFQKKLHGTPPSDSLNHFPLNSYIEPTDAYQASFHGALPCICTS
jgi:hypothetical protein